VRFDVITKESVQDLGEGQQDWVEETIRLVNIQIDREYRNGETIQVRMRRYGSARIDAETLRRLKEGDWEVKELDHDSRYFTLKLS